MVIWVGLISAFDSTRFSGKVLSEDCFSLVIIGFGGIEGSPIKYTCIYTVIESKLDRFNFELKCIGIPWLEVLYSLPIAGKDLTAFMSLPCLPVVIKLPTNKAKICQ